MGKMKKILCILLCLLLCGCTPQEQDQEAAVNGPQYWEEKPALTYGTMAYEKLEVLPWYGARGEETSDYLMVEVEQGYYLLYAGCLMYADKTDLCNWVLVCKKPDCTHYGRMDCSGMVSTGTILMRDGRLLREESNRNLPGAQKDKAWGIVLVSTALDGTDLRVESVVEETMITSEGSVGSKLTPNEWLLYNEELQEDGTVVKKWFQITPNGTQKYREETGLEYEETGYICMFSKNQLGSYGDRYYYDQYLDTTGGEIYRFEDGRLRWLDLAGMDTLGSYLSGDTLRVFRTNDGYYDISLKTGKEVKLAQPQMENSCAAIVLPNCILESTLIQSRSRELRTPDMTHRMDFFDGQSWRQVTLPKELLHAGDNESLHVFSVNSDSIFIRYWGNTGNSSVLLTLYKIDLTKEALTLEYAGKITAPQLPD